MTGNQRRHYPPNWSQLAKQCKEAAGWKCEFCGIEQYALVESRRGRPYIIYLHAAHRWHNKHNPAPELLCLCITCHSRYDYQQKQRERRISIERLRHQIALTVRVNDYRCLGG